MAFNTRKKSFAFIALCGLLLGSPVAAQLPQTRLYSLSPNGGQIGQEFEVTVASGADLEEISQLVFSNPKIVARQKTVDKNGEKVPVANVFIVNIPSDVPTGVYEARCGGLFGFSNPRRFAADNFPVAADPSDNNTSEKAAVLVLGQVVNGRLESGNDVDWFRITAKQGQRIVLDTWAERLDSRMNPVIAIYDPSGGRRLKWSRNSVGNDPVLVFDVPADGDYFVQIHDITFRNGTEYQYRLHAHTNPHLEFAWPPSGKAGTKSKFTLFGYNLPGGQKTGQLLNKVEIESLVVDIDTPAQADFLDVENRIRPISAATDAFSYRYKTGGQVSNPVRIGITPLNVVAEQEPNNEAAQAQMLTVPVEVGGQFGAVGDNDTFRYTAKAGEVYYVELTAERLGTTADPYLIINQITKKEDGTETVKRLTAQDDVATTLLKTVFETKTDDPVFRLQIPADGLYEVVVRDRYWESRGNPLLRYSLAIRKESPDFRVVAIPAAPTLGQTWPVGLRQGDQFPITFMAYRRDGFTGPIEITADKLPASLKCPSIVIGTGAISSTLVITSTADAHVGLQEISFKATAKIEDAALARAVPVAQKAVEATSKPVADFTKKLADATEKTKKPQADYDAAFKASQAKLDDESLKKKSDTLKTALDKVVAQRVAIQKQLETAQAAVASATTNLSTAKQALEKSIQTVQHSVRSGTVVWSTAANVPSISRVTNSFVLSVIAETAPFQVKSDAHKFTVNQGRQLLIPVKLEKRNGFDNKVTLTAQGLPKTANIDFPNSALEKGEAEKTLRLFVKDNSPPGIYTVWMKTSGQVGYQRNPAKAARLKKVGEAAKAKTEAAKKVSTEATQKKTAATAAFTQAQKKLQQTQAALKAADAALVAGKKTLDQTNKALAAANVKVNGLKPQVVAVEKQVADAAKALQTKKTELDAAEKTVATEQTQVDQNKKLSTESEQKLAQLNKQISEQPENAELKTQFDAATKTLNEQKSALDTSTKALQAKTVARDGLKKQLVDLTTKQQQAQKKLTTVTQQMTAAVKVATDANAKVQASTKVVTTQTAQQTAAKSEVTKSDAALKVATKAKTDSEAAEKIAIAATKTAEAAQKVADKAATDAANVAKAKNINFTPPMSSVVVEVLPAPVKLAATVPNGGKVKKGEALEVTIKVTRQNSFAGPVKLAVTLPPGVKGISADPVEVPADQAEGKLTIKTTGDAPDGAVAFVVIRGAMDFNGQAEVDAPVTLTVTK